MKRALPPINTSALPDIIFMLLFFFMTITVIRDYDDQLDIDLPEIGSKVKLDYNKRYGHLYHGGESKRLQLNDKFIDLSEVSSALSYFSEQDSDYKTKLYFDEGLKMSDVNKVKLEIRKSHALRIEYVLK